MTTIDLHLPTSWNGCTTADLEAIAAAIIQEQQRTDRYHPFDWSRVKLAVVLAINAMTVVADADIAARNTAARSAQPMVNGQSSMVNGQWSMVNGQSSMVNGQSSMVNGHTFLVRRPQDRAPWPITTGQLLALTDRLAFLDDPKANRTIFAFPYPTLDVRCKKEEGRAISHQPSAIVHLQGPAPLLDGYTWQEYRYLTDWMQEYMRCTNARQDATEPMAQFLAVLFKPAPDAQPMVNGQCSMVNGQCSMVNGQCSMFNGQWSMFNGFSPIKWQVILFWWSSLMGLLQQKFPRVFKPQPVGRDRQQKKNESPWDFYNRVTATIQKYIGGLSEHDVNAATYGTILQQLDMMAQEAQEMEKLKNKK